MDYLHRLLSAGSANTISPGKHSTLDQRSNGSVEVSSKIEVYEKNQLESKIYSTKSSKETNVTRPISEKNSRLTNVQSKRFGRYPRRMSILIPSGRKSASLTRKTSVYLMLKGVRFYFHHPYFRFFTANFILWWNILFYAQDPSNHSLVKTNLPVFGQAVSFIFLKYKPYDVSLKVSMWMFSIIIGIFFGYCIVYKVLFNNVLRLNIFSDNKGASFTSFFSTIISLYSFSYLYNEILLSRGEQNRQYLIDCTLNIEYVVFCQYNQTCTFFCDYLTAFLVTDLMMQENLYPAYFKRLRRWWVADNHRVYLFWSMLLVTTPTVVLLMFSHKSLFQWDKLELDYTFNNEIWRAFVSAFVLAIDVTIVMQDWDFPHFANPLPIHLPGLNVSSIHCAFRSWFHFVLTGKLLNYGILLFVTILDLNNWYTQTMYNPLDYAQYTHPESQRIYTAKDEFSLRTPLNETVLSFAFRNSTIDPLTGELYIKADELLSARFVGFDIHIRITALTLVAAMFLAFFTLIVVYGRAPEPTKKNPYPNLMVKMLIGISKSKLILPENLIVPHYRSTETQTPSAKYSGLGTPIN